MHWLSKVCAAVGNIYLRKLTEMPSLRGKTQQPAWGRSREFEITTRSVGRNQLNQSTTGDLDEEEMDEEDENELDHGRRKRKVAFMPSPGEALSYSARLYRRPEWIFFFRTRHHPHDLLSRSLVEGEARSRVIPKWERTQYAASQITRTRRYQDYGHCSALKIR